jgi:flagellar hook-associated protein 2
MGRIQSNVGLITGMPIQQTVDQLIALQAVPRDRLATRQRVLQAQQAALTDLTAAILGVQFAARRLNTTDIFRQRSVGSSNDSLLTATASTGVPEGHYQFVPVRLAQTHHALSSGVAARDQDLGGGTLSFRHGGHLNQGASLSDLNGGQGVANGKIKITDRSGSTAVIDLRYAQTIDDVLTAINAADEIEIEAVASGDHLRLIDNSGGAGNLRVQEVNGGSTAADLGLASINVAANSANGADLVELFAGYDLGGLNDGNGLSLRDELPDLELAFRDGTTLSIDLNPDSDDPPRTLGEVLDRLNAADPARLQASLSADGKRLQLTDLTTGGSTFAVTSSLGGSTAEELGLTTAASGDTISGRRLIAGLKTTLLGTLGGGDGLGTLGQLTLTARDGSTATVNLASSETLDDVISTINAAGIGIRAEYNSARNGISLVDTTGSTASNLIAANADGTNTATKLGLAASVAADTINSGSLDRQVVSRSTLLDSYNGGKGVGTGSFLITNSAGQSGSINFAILEPETVGDVIDAINGLAIGVTASLNAAGDGILLTDTAAGSGKLTVADVGSGTVAKNLNLAGEADATTIDGSTTVTITLEAGDTLDDLVQKINDLDAGASASVFSDRSGSLRHHLSLLSGKTGKAGELLIDGSGLGLEFHDIAAAQDALVQIGAGGAFGGQLVSSPSNDFEELLPGLDVKLNGQSSDVVSLNVDESLDSAASALQTFVDQYNKLREKLDTYTAFNATSGTKGTLFGSSETLRMDAELSRLVTGQTFGLSGVRSLAELGVSIGENGKLSFDKSKFEDRYADDPAAVEEFFTDENRGFAAKADALIERLAGPEDSTLLTRIESLQRQIDNQAERIDTLNARLDRNRERLLLQFFRTEEVVARMQASLTAISSITYIPPVQASSGA